jgi:hypothetical protein
VWILVLLFAAGSPKGLIFSDFFAPELRWWARTKVLSSTTYSLSPPTARAENYLPNAGLRPPGELPVHRHAIAKARWQVAPTNARPIPIQNRFQNATDLGAGHALNPADQPDAPPTEGV